MPNITLDAKADAALSRLQDTTLSPMEEALFKAWTKANQIQKPDAPDDTVDYRGIYKESGGTILPNGQLKQFASKINVEDKLRNILHDRMMQHIDKLTGKKVSEMPKPEQSGKDSPHQHHTIKLQNDGIAKKNEGLAHQNEGTALEHKSLALENEGKQLDIEKILAQRELEKSKPKSEGASSGSE
jgi:hypothetical protein